jgi:hypothetical protein
MSNEMKCACGEIDLSGPPEDPEPLGSLTIERIFADRVRRVEVHSPEQCVRDDHPIETSR